MRRAGKLSIAHVCSRAVSMLMFCSYWSIVPRGDASAESYLGLRSAERLCEGELCCVGHRRKISLLCLFHEIYHRANHLTHEYLHHFVAARNTRASLAQGEIALMIPCRRTNQFSPSFLSVSVRL